MLADVAKKTGSKQSQAAEKRTNQGCAGPARRDTQAGGSKARSVGQGGDWALSTGQTACPETCQSLQGGYGTTG